MVDLATDREEYARRARRQMLMIEIIWSLNILMIWAIVAAILFLY